MKKRHIVAAMIAWILPIWIAGCAEEPGAKKTKPATTTATPSQTAPDTQAGQRKKASPDDPVHHDLASAEAEQKKENKDEHAEHASAWSSVHKAIAVVHATQGNKVEGTVTFTADGDKVKVVVKIKGLKPDSKHGFHIHEFGDCSAPDAMSAGGHYNPGGHEHAGPDTMKRHAGDLGNITADENGEANYELTVDNVTIAGMKNPIIGRGVIIHEKEDDLKTQPTGNAGGRIGCGVIGVAKSDK